MSDFLVAIGLVFVLEGLLFAAFPDAAKRAMVSAAETPAQTLRVVGLVSAVLGIAAVWLIRG
jgi:uncharacterized protein YjeT (DUF2065 family)